MLPPPLGYLNHDLLGLEEREKERKEKREMVKERVEERVER